MVAIFDTQTTSPRKVSFLTQGCPTCRSATEADDDARILDDVARLRSLHWLVRAHLQRLTKAEK